MYVAKLSKLPCISNIGSVFLFFFLFLKFYFFYFWCEVQYCCFLFRIWKLKTASQFIHSGINWDVDVDVFKTIVENKIDINLRGEYCILHKKILFAVEFLMY